MEAQLGIQPILLITAKLYLQIVYAFYYKQGWYYTLFTSNYQKEDTTPWFYQLLLKGCYETLFTKNYQKEATTPWFYQLLLKGFYDTLFTNYHWNEATTPSNIVAYPSTSQTPSCDNLISNCSSINLSVESAEKISLTHHSVYKYPLTRFK